MTPRTTRPALRAAALAAASLSALAACTPEFDPASEIQGLRVLAVRAEPPELAPPGDPLAPAPSRAVLETLVAHPAFAADPARRATVVHLACTPAPGDPAGSACSALAALAEPASLLALASPEAACSAPGHGAVGAVTLAGIEACGARGCSAVTILRDPADPASEVFLPAPAYEIPDALGAGLDALPPGTPERILGVEVMTLALALDVPPEALQPSTPASDACGALAGFAGAFAGAWEGHAHVAALKRIRVRGPDASGAPNANPSFDGVALAGAPLPAPGDAPALVSPGATQDLSPSFDLAPAPETYVRRDATGAAIETRAEEWVFSWFATAGTLDELHTRSASEPEPYTAPGAGRALVYAVLRDLRGGVAWRIGEVEAR
jgi:hypothetical protein